MVEEISFGRARPIWLAGLAEAMNVTAGFRAVVAVPAGGRARLRIAAASVYRCYANGVFVGHGPAAAAHGYYRVDEWDLPAAADGAPEIVVAIEVAGYNVNSFYTLAQPSFVQAEVLTEAGEPLAWTGVDGREGFEAGELRERVRRTQRYSFQRAFTEVYRRAPDADDWRRSASAAIGARADWSLAPDKALLPRRVPYPAFAVRTPALLLEAGVETPLAAPPVYRKDRSLTGVGPLFLGYPEAELETIPSLLVQETARSDVRTLSQPYEPDRAFGIETGSYRIVDLGRVTTGFISMTADCRRPTSLYLLFDEVLLPDGGLDCLRLDAVNLVGYELAPGVHALETMEPYALRYLKLLVREGAAEIGDIAVREYVNGALGEPCFESGDGRLDAIFRAGAESYRQSAVDVFMDCPSRERAGWLCDSFFMARVAFDLGCGTAYERLFFENYMLPERFDHLPEGMVPMCYPADHLDGNFIPNWGLWFVLQLEEYVARSGDLALAERLRPRTEALLAYFDRYRNGDGLLEALDGWLFVDWSPAKEWVQDVSYPTNMLYAGALSAAGRLYGWDERLREAEAVRAVVREQAYTGKWFADHAVRTAEGALKVEVGHVSEACQYYAFCFGIAGSDSHPELWRRVVEGLGPLRRSEADGRPPGVAPTNQLIGNFLRLEALSAAGRADVLARELPALFGAMAAATGTLWEQDEPIASCCHGFASHVVHVAYRDLLGFRSVDPLRRAVVLRPGAGGLPQCAGALWAGEDRLFMSWRYLDGVLHVETELPADYDVRIEAGGIFVWERRQTARSGS